MEVKIDTEGNLDDLKQALEIIKKALERRNADKTQQELPAPSQELEPTSSLEVQKVEQPIEPPKVEAPEPSPPPSVDISALAMSDYGQKKENRTMDTLTHEKEPTTVSSPQLGEKDTVLEIITNLKRKNPDGPLYMQNIISLANAKGIAEEKARQLVSQLKEEGSI